MDKVQRLRSAYGWLKSFAESVPTGKNVNASYVEDYERIHATLVNVLEIPLSAFSPSSIRTWGSGTAYWCDGAEVASKARQLLGYVEYGYNVEQKVLEIGSLFKSIHDPELRERCGDLIVGTGPFDRVINQATLVLEDRVRGRAGLERHLVGTSLVNAAIKSDPAESTIVFSDVRSEQEGYANIIRGLMQALRNETHHTLTDSFSREDALSICGFIDRLLRIIDQTVIRK